MFLLEDRVLFDAAIAIDIADAANSDDQSDDFDNSSDNSAEQNAEAFLQSPSEAQQAMPLPVNPYIDAVVRDALDGNLADLGLDGDFALPSMDSSAQTQVLLISDSIDNADELYDTAGENTIAIRYDAANTTTEQLLEQIEQSLDGEKIDRLGIAQQSDSNGKIDLLTNDSDTELWQGLNNLMTDDASIDLFASDMADSEFTDALATLTGHEVNYSTDLTGSDGDWTLEYGGIDLADTYFDGELAQNVNFSILLAEPTHELAIINSSVMDAGNIIDDLGDNVDILNLDINLAPLEQINAYLDAHTGTQYDTIHIISHGNDGYFVLNGEVIDSEYVDKNAVDFSAMGEHLTTDGDIMLYGCNVADSDTGKYLVSQLAELTGADVAANAELPTAGHGDNWQLEFSSGLIDHQTIAVDDYAFSLANQLVTTGNDSGAGSLRQAVIDVGNGQEITFNTSVSTVIVSSEIAINHAMTITGNGEANTTVQVTTPGSSAFRVFNVTPGTGNIVTIQALTIRGGHILTGDSAANYGGAIYHDNGTLNLNSITMTNGIAYRGGGLYSKSDILNINDSNFNGNLAIFGGAIYNQATATINSTIMDNNRGGGSNGNSGGTILNDYNLALTQSTISNSGAYNGGGIANGLSFLSNATMTIEDSLITNNASSGDGGGGIFNNFNALLTIQNSTLTANTASGNGGGAIMNKDDGQLTIVNSTLTLNSSQHAGGAVHSDSAIFSLINSTVSNNSATTNGGGIFNISGNKTYIVNSAIAGNSAGGTGDDIENSGSTVYAYYSRYIGTNGTISTQGNAQNQINSYDNELGILNSNGGVTQTMMVNSGSTMIENGTESYYNATDGYYFKANDGLYHKLTAYATTVTMNTGDKLTTDQRGVTRQINQTIGAVEPDYYRTTTASGAWNTLANWEVSHDTSNWAQATATPNDINASAITINHATIVDSDVSIAETTISPSQTLTINTGTTLTITDGTGIDLTIDGQLTITGGWVLDPAATVTATTGSYVLYDGGNQNIAVMAYAKLGLEGDNTIKTFGDDTTIATSVTEEILLTSAGMTLTANGAANATVQVTTPGANGTAARVFNSNPGAGNTLTIENITIKGGDISGLVDNAALGGTIFHQSGTLAINNAVISGSKALNGGAVYSQAIITVTGSNISFGHATNNGGGIYNAFSDMTLTDTTVANNLADRSGGGVGSFKDISTTIENSTVSDNDARLFAGVYSYDSNLVLNNSTVANNTATAISGGVGSFKGTISLLNTTISNNTATTAFGAVYNNNSQLYMVNSIVIENPLSGGGTDNSLYTSAGGNSFAFYSWYDGSKVVGALTTNTGAPNLTSPSDGTLSALADNGGSTWTIAVQTGSNIIANGTYIYHNFIDGYYFSDQSGTTFHHLDYSTFTPSLSGGKITTDERGFTRDPAFIPTMGAYEFNTSMVDELPNATEYSTDEFSDLIKVHSATQNEFDVALLEFIV